MILKALAIFVVSLICAAAVVAVLAALAAVIAVCWSVVQWAM